MDHAAGFHDGEAHPLPEGQEDDALDGEELEGGVIGPQELLGGRVEEEEGVQGHRDAGVETVMQLYQTLDYSALCTLHSADAIEHCT